MKGLRKVLASLLSFIMALNFLVPIAPVYAEKENLALGKEVSASSFYPAAKGDEARSPELVVDGDQTGKSSRWASLRSGPILSNTEAWEYGDKEQWIMIDLKEVYSIDQIDIYWEAAYASKYLVQTSMNGETFDNIKEISDCTSFGLHSYDNLNVKEAKYVRVYCQKAFKENWGYSIYEIEIYGQEEIVETDNLALNKTATASSSYPDRPWTPDKAVDGVDAGDSRWSSKRATGGTNDDEGSREQWLMVDLGKTYQVNQVNIIWENAFATQYRIEYSLDGEAFNNARTCNITNAGLQVHKKLNIESARYIRIYCVDPKIANYGYSIYELEVYEKNLDSDNAQDILDSLNAAKPTFSEDGKKLVLPKIEDGFEISLFGSDNEQVVKKDGTIIKPLVDMDVNLLYKVQNKTDDKDFATSEKDIKITVPGQFKKETGDNALPNVLPGLREWKGHQGEFTLTNDSKIIVNSSELNQTAQTIQSYFKDMLNKDIKIESGTAKKGDIYLVKGSTKDYLGDEGYLLEIDDCVTITAPTKTGVLYGGASITQILYQTKNMNKALKGISRDYPKYEVRSGMIDVGRMYIPLDYLEEMTIYMSWFKMNEIQVHVNDYWGNSGYSAFRLESEVYPEIVAEDGYYTKKDYKQYQKNMKQYAIDVITEIDTPYHAECFRAIDESMMLSKGALDIRNKKSYEVIENLMDEYLDGENPVIQSDNFHIGTDEYNQSYKEEMRAWTDHFINYVNDKGYNTRLWGSLGGGTASNGFTGTTPVSNEATVNLWAPYWADVKETYKLGYDVINTCGGWLYIVPAGNAGYPDRLDIASLYNKFDVNNFEPNRYPGQGTTIMPVAHPQTVGAEFAIWNDMTSFKTGYSWFDIYDRMKDAVAITAEKTWYGEKTEGQTSDQFVNRVDNLIHKAPGTNPGRSVDSDTDLVTNLDFYESDKDLSGNNYHPTLSGATIKDNVLDVSQDGYLKLPFDSIGYPYTTSIKLNIPDIKENTVLFTGEDGTFYANIDGTGKLGFKRGAYRFAFEYTLEEDTWTTLTFTSDQSDTYLYVNGKKIGSAKTMDPMLGGHSQKSDTSTMTFEKVLPQVSGQIENMSIYNRVLTDQEILELADIAGRDNLALKKPVTVSGLEVNDGRFTAEMAVDGLVSSESRVSFDKTKDEQWMVVDLGDTYFIQDFVINYESQVPKYKILVSTDGQDYTEVYNFEDATLEKGGASGIHEIHIDPTEARYVKYQQLKRWQHLVNGNFYSGSIYEFEVYELPNLELLRTIETAKTELEKQTVGYLGGNLHPTFYAEMITVLENYEAIAKGNAISEIEMMRAKKVINGYVDDISNSLITLDYSQLLDVIDKAENLNEDDYTPLTWNGLDIVLTDVKKMLKDTTIQQNDIDDACASLTKVIEDLVKLADKTELEKTLKKAKAIDQDNYTTTSCKTLNETILAAEKMIKDKNVSQREVDDAKNNLDKAIEYLVEVADKQALEEELTKAKNIDKSLYTEESYKELSEAIQLAEKVIANKDATVDEIDEAISALQTAQSHLEKVFTDEGKKPTDDDKRPIDKDESEGNVLGESVEKDTTNNNTTQTSDDTHAIPYVGLTILGLTVIFLSRKKKYNTK